MNIESENPKNLRTASLN